MERSHFGTELNWTPLEKAVPPSLLGAFMHMGEVGTIQRYKHRDKRRYLYIDSDCTRFYELRHRGEDNVFVEVDRGAALRYALAMCCCDDPGVPEGVPQQTCLRSLPEPSLSELCSETEPLAELTDVSHEFSPSIPVFPAQQRSRFWRRVLGTLGL